MAKQDLKRRAGHPNRGVRFIYYLPEYTIKQIVSEKTIISTCTLISSLASYYYSEVQKKESAPCVMIGGFIGTWVGELIVKLKNRKTKKVKNGNNNN